MAGGDPVPMTGTWGERLLALGMVVLCATCGGVLVQIMMKGCSFKTGKVGPINMKPLQQVV
jgi:hypothetical protein